MLEGQVAGCGIKDVWRFWGKGIVCGVVVCVEVDVAAVDAIAGCAVAKIMQVEVQGGIAALREFHVDVFFEVIQHGTDVRFLLRAEWAMTIHDFAVFHAVFGESVGNAQSLTSFVAAIVPIGCPLGTVQAVNEVVVICRAVARRR